LTIDINSTYIELGASAYDRLNLNEQLTTPDGNFLKEDIDDVIDLPSRNLTVTITGTVDTSVPGNYTITYSATDSHNNSASKTRTVIVQNNQPPVITLLGNNPLNLNKGTTYIEPGVSAVDALGNILTVSSSNNINKDVLGIYTVTYLVSDSFGNNQTATRTVIVVDLTGPVVILLGDNPMTIELGTAYIEPGATAYDRFNINEDLTNEDGTGLNLDLEPGIDINSRVLPVTITGVVNTNLPGTYTRSYTATDSSNNSTTVTRSIIVQNNQNPVITLVGDNPFNLSLGLNYIEPGVSAVDALGNIVTVTSTNNINKDIVGLYQVNYSATDSYGNTGTAIRNVGVSDLIGPVIILNGVNHMTIELGTNYIEPGATAYDRFNIGDNFTNDLGDEFKDGFEPNDFNDRLLPVTITGIVNTNVPGTYTRTYFATDVHNNSTTVTRTIIVQNNQDPIITLVGDNPLILDVGTDYSEPGVSSTDALGVSVNVIVTSNINKDVINNYTVTYTATDSYGNIGTSSRIIHVRDRTSPTITLNGNNSISLELNETYFELGASAVDNYDSSVSVVTTGIVATSMPGTYTRTYTATDSSGNTSSKIRTITVSNNEDPIITLSGANPFILNVNTNYIEPGVTASDALGTIISVSSSNNINSSIINDYTVTYSASDDFGNTSTVTRTVQVRDNIGPIITLNGLVFMPLNINQTYIELGASAVDNYDSNVTVNIDSSAVNTSLPGIYEVIYSATDSSGNNSTRLRTVSVSVNDDPIIIKRGGGGIIIHDIDDIYEDLGATSTDALGENVIVESSGSVDTSTIGDYTITYTATDEYGNIATSTRIIQVRDRTAPNLEINGNSNITLQLNDTYTELGATATDNHDTSLNVQTTGSVNTLLPGIYDITYNVTDDSNNSTTLVRKVTVENNILPVINVQGDNPTVLEVNNNYIEPGVSSIDALGNSVNISPSDNIDKTTIGNYQVTYTATDSYGNQSTSTRTVQVRDLTSPVITINGNVLNTLELNQTYTELGATALDNHDNNVTINTDNSAVNTSLPGIYQVTYTATDDSNNVSTVLRTVAVENNNPPGFRIFDDDGVDRFVSNEEGNVVLRDTDKNTIEGGITVVDTQGQSRVAVDSTDITLNVGETYNEPGVTSEDALGNEVLITVTSDLDTNVIGDYSIIYTSTDIYGNTNILERTVRVRDINAPEINIIGEKNIVLQLNDVYVDQGAEAFDSEQGEHIIVSVVNNVVTNTPGIYTVIYTAIDDSGNQSQAERIVSVENNLLPVITLEGVNPMTIAFDSIYIEPGVSAVDALGNTVNVISSNNIIKDQIGDYTVTYTANDLYTNTKIITRTVKVRDNIKPIITLNGSETLTLQLNDNYVELLATATDNETDVLLVNVSGNVDTSTPGIYTIIYSATDSSGNISTKNRIIAVENNIKPTIQLQGDNPLVLGLNDNYIEPGVSSTDALGNTVIVNSVNNINNTVIGSYTVTYTANDLYSNTKVLTRTVNVVDDNLPIITVIGDNPKVITKDTIYSDLGATAVDSSGNNLNVVTTGSVDTSTQGTYIITYTATNSNSIQNTATRTVTVIQVPLQLECLTQISNINIQSNKLVLNYTGTEVFDSNKVYGLGQGIYKITNIDNDHPIAVIPAPNSGSSISYTGTILRRTDSASLFGAGTPDGNIYQFYSGEVTVTVLSDFGLASIFDGHYGNIEGDNIFTYSETCNILPPPDNGGDGPGGDPGDSGPGGPGDGDNLVDKIL